MLQPPPAQPGMHEQDVDTPALLLDLDAFEHNLARMQALLAPTGAKLRAHAKTHKSPVIAHRQIGAGAIGQCVQKVAEAERMVWGGVRDVIVTNEIVGDTKLARLAALAPIADIAACVDDPANLARLEAAAEAARQRLPVLVEIDVGHGRCGLPPGPPAVALAQAIARSPHLRFAGLQAYHGNAQHLRTPEQRHATVTSVLEGVRRTTEQLRQQGLDCPTIGGGGTGTFELEAASGLYTEIQAGSYCFMDADYGRNQGGASAGFQQALFVLATTMSAARPGLAVVDAGHKAVAIDSGLPLVWNRPGLAYTGASDEHGKLEGDNAPHLGEKIRLVPGHCDPTVDRYDWYVGVRRGRVECLWPITARGAMH